MSGQRDSFDQLEYQLGDDRQQRRRNRTLEDQPHIVQGKARHDRITKPTRTDERRKRSRANADHGGRAYTGQHGGQRQRDIHIA